MVNFASNNILGLLLERPTLRRRKNPHHGYPANVAVSLQRVACSSDDEHSVLGSHSQANGVPPFACSFSKTPGMLHMLAVADEDGHVSLFDTRGTSKLVKEWSAHNNAIFDLAWADTDPWIVTAAGDQTAALWDVSRGCRLAVFKQHSSSLKSASFRHGDRNVFATGSRDGRIMVWDVRCNHKEGPPSFHTPVNIIADGHVPTMPSTPKPAKRQRLTPSTASSKSSVTAVVFQDDFSLISTGATESTVKVWDIRTIYKGSNRKPMPKQEYPYCGTSTRNIGFSSLVLNSSRSCVYASCTDDVIYAFNCLGVNRYPVATYMGHSNATFYVKSALSVDDTFLLSGSSDNKAYIWKVSEPSSDPVQLTGHLAEVTSVAWSPLDFPKLVTCADDNSLRVWRLHNLKEEQLTDSKDIVGKAVLEKPKPRMNSPGVLSPRACLSPRPLSRRCISPVTPVQSTKPVLKKNSSIKSFFAKKRPVSPDTHDNSKVLKLMPKNMQEGKDEIGNGENSLHDAKDMGNKEETTISKMDAPESKNFTSVCKENEPLCQKLPESPPTCRIPLSPRKGDDNIHSRIKENGMEQNSCNDKSKASTSIQDNCKENQRVALEDENSSVRRMLSWPNSIEVNHKKSFNPCQGCKVNNSLPVKRKPSSKITGYFKRLSKDKPSQEERGQSGSNQKPDQ